MLTRLCITIIKIIIKWKKYQQPWVGLLSVVVSVDSVLVSSAELSVHSSGKPCDICGSSSFKQRACCRCLVALSFISLIKWDWLLSFSALQKLLKLFSDPFSKYRNIHSLRSHVLWTSYNHTLFDIQQPRCCKIKTFFKNNVIKCNLKQWNNSIKNAGHHSK